MVLYRFCMDVDLDEPIKRDHTANVKNRGIRRLAASATSVSFNGIPSTSILSRRSLNVQMPSIDNFKLSFYYGISLVWKISCSDIPDKIEAQSPQ